MTWQVQEAKQRFSEVIRAAQTGEPQIVTRHGEEIVVIVDISQFRHLHGQTTSLMDYLVAAPHIDVDRDLDRDLDLDIERRRDAPRRVDLAVER
jgi:prevent-host-death family protein